MIRERYDTMLQSERKTGLIQDLFHLLQQSQQGSSQRRQYKRYRKSYADIFNFQYMFSKMCTKCRIVKSFDHFSPSKRPRDGMACHCKECHQIDCRESRRRQKEERIVEQEIYENNIHNLEVDLIVLMMGLALVVVVSIILMAIL